MRCSASSRRGLAKLLLLACCVAAAGCCTATSGIPYTCALGCPHDVAIVCGDDGHDYQSSCLAVCQSVRVVHWGPCEEIHGRHPGKIRLHKVLESAPPSKPHAAKQRVLQQQQGQQPHVNEYSSSQPLLQSDMHAYRHHGFKLIGRVKFADAAEVDRLQKQQQQQQQQWQGPWHAGTSGFDSTNHAGHDAKTIRALRITPAGLLYAAAIDREALEAELRLSSQKPGSVPATGTRSRSLSQTGKKAAGGCTEATIKAWQHAPAFPQLPNGVLPQSNAAPTEDVVMSACAQLPDMPPYNPWATQDTHSASHSKPQQRRRLLNDTNSDCPAETGCVSVTTAAGSTGSGSGGMDTCPGDKFPFTAVGQLLLPKNRACTGSLVGADAVLTAAHCVFLKDENGGGKFTGVTSFAVGRQRVNNAVKDPDGQTGWSCATIFNTYEDVPPAYQFQWDVCVIRLAERVGDTVGWLGMASGCATSASSGKPVLKYPVMTAGYPTSMGLGTCATSTCDLIKDDCKARTCYHNCPSLDGQSGSPFFLPNENRIRAILVGKINGAGGSLNVAHVVGTGSYSSILTWVTESISQATKGGGDDVTFTKDSSKPSSPPSSSTQGSSVSTSQSPVLSSTVNEGNISSPSPSPNSSTDSNNSTDVMSPSPSPADSGASGGGSQAGNGTSPRPSPSPSPSPDTNATSPEPDMITSVGEIPGSSSTDSSSPAETSPGLDGVQSTGTDSSPAETSPSVEGHQSTSTGSRALSSVTWPRHTRPFRRRPPPCKFLRKGAAC